MNGVSSEILQNEVKVRKILHNFGKQCKWCFWSEI